VRLARPERRRRPETIIALIDVVFFLLVFFMLVGRMDATAPFEVLPPVARSGSDMPGGGVTVSIAADGRLALDGVGRERAALLDALAEALREAPEVLVRINADRGAELRRVLPLVGEIEALGAREVVLVLTPAAP
jgi:biopolymer transport protein ExbD